MAIANLMRYSTRTILTGVGLALAIAVVLFVNVIALSFESGASAVYHYIRSTSDGSANVWITPASGMELDRSTGFFRTDGTLPESLADQVLQSTKGIKVVLAPLPNSDVMIYGRSDRQTVSMNQAALRSLAAKAGNTVQLNQVTVRVDQSDAVPELGAGGLVEMPLATAQKVLDLPGAVHWVMLKSPDAKGLSESLKQQNILVTTDPTMKAQSESAVAYLLEDKLGRGDMVTFDVKLAAIYFNQASSTLLGWLAKITLALGFVLMLSAALLSIEERRREFGILTAVGVSSDVLYLFLMESLILFVGSTLLGIVLGIGLLNLLVPSLFDWGTVLKSVALVICYLPPMIIFGSLIPAQQLLRKSPLELLRTATC
jgi:ABC-type antimicrobial peptide transport system permease subunit